MKPDVDTTSPLTQALSINKGVACLFILMDFILFGGEFFSLGVSWLISIPVAFVLGIICLIVQKVDGDSFISAFMKALILSIITAIPLPLGAIVPLLLGFGPSIFSSLFNEKKNNIE